MAACTVRDCGPRDGLQPLAPLAPGVRAELARRLVASGVAHVEVASFVRPEAVPAMAGGDEVLAELGPGTAWWVLVPNARGAELAAAAGAEQLTVTVSASEGYSRKNTRRSIAESLAEFDRIRSRVPTATLDAVISCCFGSPFDVITPGAVAGLVVSLRAAGADRITLADTTGTASPARIERVLDLAGTDLGLHLHDSRGTALVNAYAAWLAGVTRFDTSIGGLGGSPFAPGAGGNLATEELVLLLEELGASTGIDLLDLLVTGRWLASRIGAPLPSRVAAAGRLDDWSATPATPATPTGPASP